MSYKKKYKDALLRARELTKTTGANYEYIFPELLESENERIKNKLIKLIKMSSKVGGFALHKWEADEMVTWLEKQSEKTSWKPSKEEMDVLYGLAYITNQYDEHKEEVITRLYQDLKREFFNGSIYENMFSTNTSTENDVRRRSIIQVLEYARSLDAYNQYGKEDIDKNIAWLEKQGNKPQGKTAIEVIPEENIDNTNKVEPRFHEGDFIKHDKANIICHVISVNSGSYYVENIETGYRIELFNAEQNFHLWTIQDAKDGDVIWHSDTASNGIFIFKEIRHDGKVLCYCDYDSEDHFCTGEYHTCCWSYDKYIQPATKKQRDHLFEKMKEAGYEFDFEEKELKKIERKKRKST